MKAKSFAGLLVSVAVVAAGCEMFEKDHHASEGTPAGSHAQHASADSTSGDGSMQMAEEKVAVATIKPSSAAATQPANNNVTGTVTFTQMCDKVQVVGHIEGLEPNSEHGFHIHEKGDLSAPDLSSAGPHFNPAGHHHGAPGAMSHAGDLGNIKADDSGKAVIDLDDDQMSFEGPNCILGRGLVVHEKADDLKSQPAGDAGPRIAVGVIGLAEVKAPAK
jgi:Cu-Zn family superoxide dismutase